MKPLFTTFAVLLALTAAFAADHSKPTVPLFDGLGTHCRPIKTTNPQVQRYFDQGLMFMFAYNHDEAVRAFRQATQLDPDCAMAFWGIALASGMNYNDPKFTEAKAKIATEAMTRAQALAAKESPIHQAMIAALAARYHELEPDKRPGAEKAYSAAMKAVWDKHPTDADVGSLYAESLMNLRPWDLWKPNGEPQAETPEILRALEAVLKLAPTHPLANHLYIHAVEASPEPGKADAAADALRGQHPALGHLLHMPSHIDIRRGRWRQAEEANRLAIDADAKYQQAVPEQGFYQFYMVHNYHMLTFAATMQGRSDVALKTIRAAIAAVPKVWIAVKENAAVADGFLNMPMEVLKRFGRWDDILKEPEMPEIFPIARTLRHYNRGIAFAAQGKLDDARNEQKAFHDASQKVAKDAIFSNNKAADLFAIADKMLEGEIQLREGKLDAAITTLEQAVALEDKLRYAEPPDWFVPARHALGATLLRARRNADAEKVYKEDLRRWPDNGWSLFGLARALEAQDKPNAEIKRMFEIVWKDADVQIPSSCFCVVE